MGCLGFRGMRHVLLALAAFFPVNSDAWAWGDQGHKVICEISFRLVQPNTRAEIRKLIGTDEQFNTFSDSCIWPDHPRQRASEHFVNLPRDSDRARRCAAMTVAVAAQGAVDRTMLVNLGHDSGYLPVADLFRVSQKIRVGKTARAYIRWNWSRGSAGESSVSLRLSNRRPQIGKSWQEICKGVAE
jgi:hypothetical protein